MAKVTVNLEEKFGGKAGLVGKDFPTSFCNDTSARFNPPTSKNRGKISKKK